MTLAPMHILSKAAAKQEVAGFSMNFSDRALDLIADEVDWDAGSLMLWLTATGKLQELKEQDDNDEQDEQSDDGHLPEPTEEPNTETDDEQDTNN